MAGPIAVMGAGVMGLSLAWELARRGRAVVVVEADRPGAGASGGLVGALAPHAPDDTPGGWTEAKDLQIEALLMAGDWWAGVAAAGGVDPGYGRLGRVQPIKDAAARDRAAARAQAAHRLWRGQAIWEVRAADSVPGLRLACAEVIFDTLAARIAPRRAISALVAALAAKGIGVIRGSLPPAGPDTVVWADGAAGLDRLGLGIAQKGQAALLGGDWRAAPQVYAPGLHIVPHADGTVAVGSTSERDFVGLETDTLLDGVIARARALCPELADAPVLARWAGLRPRVASRQPVLGPLPGRAGEWVLNGGFKTGFAMAPLLAGMLADRLMEGGDRIPADWRPGPGGPD